MVWWDELSDSIITGGAGWKSRTKIINRFLDASFLPLFLSPCAFGNIYLCVEDSEVVPVKIKPKRNWAVAAGLSYVQPVFILLQQWSHQSPHAVAWKCHIYGQHVTLYISEKIKLVIHDSTVLRFTSQLLKVHHHHGVILPPGGSWLLLLLMDIFFYLIIYSIVFWKLWFFINVLV